MTGQEWNTVKYKFRFYVTVGTATSLTDLNEIPVFVVCRAQLGMFTLKLGFINAISMQ
jgi:hypothetical protein